MSTGFQFKQFFIAHDHCAMKVGTDGILLGSWVRPNHATHILDIGTGSGLLAIMLAQRSPQHARILGVEIDARAAAQATANARQSPWPQKVDIRHLPVQSLFTAQPFELIVSNPPYYPPGQQFDAPRQTARHQGSLSLAELTHTVHRLLADNGQFCCVLPVAAAQQLEQICVGVGLHLNRRCLVSTVDHKPPSRALLQYSRRSQALVQEQLVIRDAQGRYSHAYRQLCQPYYLNF